MLFLRFLEYWKWIRMTGVLGVFYLCESISKFWILWLFSNGLRAYTEWCRSYPDENCNEVKWQIMLPVRKEETAAKPNSK